MASSPTPRIRRWFCDKSLLLSQSSGENRRRRDLKAILLQEGWFAAELCWKAAVPGSESDSAAGRLVCSRTLSKGGGAGIRKRFCCRRVGLQQNSVERRRRRDSAVALRQTQASARASEATSLSPPAASPSAPAMSSKSMAISCLVGTHSTLAKRATTASGM